jgi:predicted nucleotidyltransferase
MDLHSIKNKALPVLSEAGVIRSSLFGSVVSGDYRADSDIDVLVKLPRGKTLLDLVDLQLKLAKALGKPVDVLTYQSISPYLKRSILSHQYPLL